MQGFDLWLSTRGAAVATALEERRDHVCESASARFAQQFEMLLLDLPRPDAAAFQRLAFRETPLRLHRLLQVVLRFQTLAVVEREYRWSWGILPRYGITLSHMLEMVRAYFSAARALAPLDQADMQFVEHFERQVLVAVERAAPVEAMRQHQPYSQPYSNGKYANGKRNN